MNKDLAGVSAIWRALFGVRDRRFYCFICVLVASCQITAENGFAADYGSVSGDGHSSRCCTLEEFSQDGGCVSVMAVQEKCDEKRQGRVRTSCAASDAGSKLSSQLVQWGYFANNPPSSSPPSFCGCNERTDSGSEPIFPS